MSDILVATGQELYNMAIAGAKLGFNRSTDDYTKYEASFKRLYDTHLSELPRKIRRELSRKTKGDWRLAELPIYFLMYHAHIMGKPSRVHVRAMIPNGNFDIIDVPLDDWQRLDFKMNNKTH
jgi:hypothetical protein